MTPRPRNLIRIAALAAVLALAACATKPKQAEKPAETPAAEPAAPTVTRGEFQIEADKNDTWNAVGQIAVRTPGVEYRGRAQMMDIYSVRYRGKDFMLQTKAMLLSDTIKKTTTRVTATTQDGKPIDDDAVAELLGIIERQLPDEVVKVHAALIAQEKAKAAQAKAKKSKAKKKSKKK